MKRLAIVRPILKMINICELFKSIQGESTYAGKVCTFIRLSGCNLRCSYCDTEYAFDKGYDISIDDIVKKVDTYNCSLVEITGGEPLMQSETPLLCKKLLALGYTVLIETNGSYELSKLDKDIIKIVDIKCPGSGSMGSFLIKNLDQLSQKDECKFVVSGKEDFYWALKFINNNRIDKICTVIFSPNLDSISSRELAELIIKNNAPVRLGIQLHKIIWDKNKRGV